MEIFKSRGVREAYACPWTKANVNCSILKECLDFLTKQGLVEETKLLDKKEKSTPAITQLGLKVLEQFREHQRNASL